MLETTILNRTLQLGFQEEIFETTGVDTDVAPKMQQSVSLCDVSRS